MRLPFQRSELALRMKDVIKAKAKENQGKRTDLNILDISPKCEPVNTREESAKLAGVSDFTIRQASKILEKGTSEQKERARAGEKSSNYT